MNQQPKIALYSGEIPSTTFIERLIEGLSKKGVEVYLFGKQNKKTRYPGKVKQFTHGNKFAKFCQWLYYTLLLQLQFPADKRKLDRLIAKRVGNPKALKAKYYPVLYHRPDIFHLQWAKGIAEWIWVEEFNMRLVLSLRGTHITISPYTNERLANEYKTIFPKVSGFHAVSEAIVKTAANFGAEASKAKVIYSGLNLNELPFQFNKPKREAKFRILAIGRAHWVKGYEYALDAMHVLKAQGFSFEYKMIGLGEDESLIFQRAQLNLEKEVVFEKKKAFEEVKKRIQQADVLLLSSVEEGIANVVLEAMALGTLVVTTNCGGMSEVIQSEENGILVPARNPEAIAQALVKAAALTPEEYQALTLKARAIVEVQHSEKKMVDEMLLLYNQVIKS